MASSRFSSMCSPLFSHRPKVPASMRANARRTLADLLAAGSCACAAWKRVKSTDGWEQAFQKANITTAALERWLWSRRSFEQLLVPDAIPRPRQSVEAFRIDRPAVDQALSIGAVLDSSQRILHLLQNCRLELRFGEVLAFGLVGDARIASIRSSVD